MAGEKWGSDLSDLGAELRFWRHAGTAAASSRLTSKAAPAEWTALAGSPACQVDVVTDLPSLLALQPVWDALVARAAPRHPFLDFEWMRTWWECFGESAELRVLVVRAGETPIAIAPLMTRRVQMYGLELRTLEFPLNDHTPRFDLILSDRPQQACRAIWSHLRAQAGSWDLLLLRQLPDDSPALIHLAELAEADGCLVGVRQAEESPYVPFTGAWSAYVSQLSRNHRSKIRKGLNRLARVGTVALEIVSAPGGVAGALTDGLRIEAAAWKQQNGTAMCSHEAVQRFYQLLADRAARAGILRLLFLTVNGRRIAFAYGFEYRDRLFVLKAGYDPAFARYSPYNLLCALVFEDGFARGLAEYEFLGGNEAWKLDWTRHTRPHYWLFVFRPGMKTRALHLAKCRAIPWLESQAMYRRVRDTILALRRGSARI